MELETLCTKLESMEYVRRTLLNNKTIKEIHAPLRYEAIIRAMLTPHYGEVILSGICLYVSPHVPDDKIYFVYADGTEEIADLATN